MSDAVTFVERWKEFDPSAVGMRCNIEQYRMLRRCSDAGDPTEWNDWRAANPDAHVRLCGAGLSRLDLRGANLRYAELQAADLSGAMLQGTDLRYGLLSRADLSGALMDRAVLLGAHLDRANLLLAQLRRANLLMAHLERAQIVDAHLEGADLRAAHLEGAELGWTDLRGARASSAFVDGETRIWGCWVDRATDFGGVGLDAANVDPGLKQTLRDNTRELQWRKWCRERRYSEHPWYRGIAERAGGRIVGWFWWVSDYGRSTIRILKTFFVLAAAFGLVYYTAGLLDSLGVWGRFDGRLITNLFVIDGRPVAWWLVPFRALSYGVVTMVKLGFSGMRANPANVLGHVMVATQVFLGYVLLGALVTRFAILFSGEGPAENLSPTWEPDEPTP